jgi:hypothetical protein
MSNFEQTLFVGRHTVSRGVTLAGSRSATKRLGADMSVTRIIILAIAGGLAYAGLSAGIVRFATLIPSF